MTDDAFAARVAAAEVRIARERELAKRTFERSPSGGLIRWQGMVWGGPHKARRVTQCAWSGKQIDKGCLIFAPISNGTKRMLRVLASEWPE